MLQISKKGFDIRLSVLGKLCWILKPLLYSGRWPTPPSQTRQARTSHAPSSSSSASSEVLPCSIHATNKPISWDRVQEAGMVVSESIKLFQDSKYCGVGCQQKYCSKFSNWSNWKEEAWKISGLQRDSNPWPPRHRCNARPTELWSHKLGTRSICWVQWNIYEIHIVLRL